MVFEFTQPEPPQPTGGPDKYITEEDKKFCLGNLSILIDEKRAERCRGCNRITSNEYMNAFHHCPDC